MNKCFWGTLFALRFCDNFLHYLSVNMSIIVTEKESNFRKRVYFSKAPEKCS